MDQGATSRSYLTMTKTKRHVVRVEESGIMKLGVDCRVELRGKTKREMDKGFFWENFNSLGLLQ